MSSGAEIWIEEVLARLEERNGKELAALFITDASPAWKSLQQSLTVESFCLLVVRSAH